ncbi:hypothetical protein B0H16DRAFT_1724523 [Mycena metata]|uniref:Uncharacterized protein n=1 Tax=Mycena metata TaxID=1033252 RepID=A0AAD7N9Q8_9AGAR|nr:hypothetical protein B0H16DRAFT_1724523 [Mycena metata]
MHTDLHAQTSSIADTRYRPSSLCSTYRAHWCPPTVEGEQIAVLPTMTHAGTRTCNAHCEHRCCSCVDLQRRATATYTFLSGYSVGSSTTSLRILAMRKSTADTYCASSSLFPPSSFLPFRRVCGTPAGGIATMGSCAFCLLYAASSRSREMTPALPARSCFVEIDPRATGAPPLLVVPRCYPRGGSSSSTAAFLCAPVAFLLLRGRRAPHCAPHDRARSPLLQATPAPSPTSRCRGAHRRRRSMHHPPALLPRTLFLATRIALTACVILLAARPHDTRATASLVRCSLCASLFSLHMACIEANEIRQHGRKHEWIGDPGTSGSVAGVGGMGKWEEEIREKAKVCISSGVGITLSMEVGKGLDGENYMLAGGLRTRTHNVDVRGAGSTVSATAPSPARVRGRCPACREQVPMVMGAVGVVCECGHRESKERVRGKEGEDGKLRMCCIVS